MEAALSSSTDWLEGDVRASLDDPAVIEMRHDLGRENGSLSLREWLALGLKSGRGLKLDIKEPALTPRILDLLAGAPGERLMFNLGADQIAVYGAEIRRRFPDAYLAINPGKGGLRPEGLAFMVSLADGLTTFVLREDLLTDDVIGALRGHGSISVWNDPNRVADGSIEERILRMRARGVDGMIDLR